MMLEIYGWTLLVLFPIGYAAFITDIEWVVLHGLRLLLRWVVECLA